MATLLACANVLIFACLGALTIYNWACKRGDGWSWLRLAQILISVYWSGLYLFVLLTPAGIYNPVLFGQVFVRPAFTLTGGVMLAVAIMKARQNLPCKFIEKLKGRDNER